MANTVLIQEALTYSEYTPDHIRYLLIHKYIQGKKVGGVWLVDLESLQTYEQKMKDAGTAKFRPKSLDEEHE